MVSCCNNEPTVNHLHRYTFATANPSCVHVGQALNSIVSCLAWWIGCKCLQDWSSVNCAGAAAVNRLLSCTRETHAVMLSKLCFAANFKITVTCRTSFDTRLHDLVEVENVL